MLTIVCILAPAIGLSYEVKVRAVNGTDEGKVVKRIADNIAPV